VSRETAIIQALVDMADTLVEDFDVVDLLTGLTDRCVNLLGVSAAGVMLVTPGGDLHLVASSSEVMRIVEIFELQAQEGPCLDAFRSGGTVDQQSLRAASERWPRFSVAALDAGFESVLAMPLRLRDNTLGALNLFSVGQAAMEDADLVVARAFADLATISIVQHRAAVEAQLLNDQLTHALNSRIVIEQAKGIISERAGIDLPAAFARLRAYARSHNLKLTDVAQSAITGTLPERAWTTRPG
jgi:GAF domain-containing protein